MSHEEISAASVPVIKNFKNPTLFYQTKSNITLNETIHSNHNYRLKFIPNKIIYVNVN